MIIIDNILVSDDVIQKKFVCDLARCKGGCCEEGDAGAPLEDNELEIIPEVYEKIKPYLSPESIAWVEKKGKYVYHKDFGWVTPTLPFDKELCVYAVRDKNSIIKCAFEQAYTDGAITWKKPISCHLFPVVVEKGKKGNYDRMNYEPRRKICNSACVLGEKIQMSLYQFLKEPIIRKFGEDFFKALEKSAQIHSKHEPESP